MQNFFYILILILVAIAGLRLKSFAFRRYYLISIIDGDTIYVFDSWLKKIFKVRFIGIDSPESNEYRYGRVEKYGKEAKEGLFKILQICTKKDVDVYGCPIELEFDYERKDKYNRTLAYVYCNGVMLNREMLRQGWATSISIGRNRKYSKQFEKIEKKAKKEKRGIWQ